MSTSSNASKSLVKLEFRDVSSEYARRKEHTIVLRHVSFKIHEGEKAALVGPSGSGKTTLLKTILDIQDYGGEILLDGRDIESVPLKDRHLAYIAQRRVLYPFMSVFDNIAFPLRRLHMDAESIKKKVGEAAKTLGITLLLPRRISQLSLGQQQKVALAKALCSGASLYLFDEPFSNLPQSAKKEIWEALNAVSASSGATFFFVTHDLQEASAYADRVIVLEEGKVTCSGTPYEVSRKKDGFYAQGLEGSAYKEE